MIRKGAIINLGSFDIPYLIRLFTVFVTTLAIMSGCSSNSPDGVALPSDSNSMARGRELVKGLAACGYCHGEEPNPASLLMGGLVQYDLYGEVQAPNITTSGSGIGSWSDKELVDLFRRYIHQDQMPISVQNHEGYEWLSDSDLLSILSYLRTIPPIENSVKRRELSFIDRNTKGFLEKRQENIGFVPEIPKKHKEAYGQYLVDNVARCVSCHNSPSGFFSNSEYLQGGRIIKNKFGEKVAPGITPSGAFGIGSWSEEQLVNYLTTGSRPNKTLIDRRFCPVEFYANANTEDLQAIAYYLKSLQIGQ